MIVTPWPIVRDEIRRRMTERGLSLRAVQAITGITHTTIRDAVNGTSEDIQWSTAVKLLAAVGLDFGRVHAMRGYAGAKPKRKGAK